MSSGDSTEILIHITAPSRTGDDARFRTLASEYLEFQPARRIEFLRLSDGTSAISEPNPQPPGGAHHIVSSPKRARNVIFSPNLSFEGALDNIDSLKAKADQKNETNQETQSSWHSPPSVVQDSCPDNCIALPQYSSPTRILEFYISGFEGSQSGVSPSKRPSGAAAIPPPDSSNSGHEKVASKVPEVSSAQRLALPIVYSLTSSVSNASSPIRHVDRLGGGGGTKRPVVLPGLPLSPALIPNYPLVRQKRSQVEATIPTTSSNDDVIPSSLPSQSDDNGVIHIASSNLDILDLSSVSRADSEPPPNKRFREASVANGEKSLIRSSSGIGPRQNPEKTRVPTLTQRSLKHRDKLSIYSPEPEVGVGSMNPEHIITEQLKKLAKDYDIESRFQPVERTRELRPFERGHWLVDCSSWEVGRSTDAWEFLANYVGSGTAGWGIWCRRDEQFQWIKVFCWGQVVAHLYFVVHLASRRELKYTSGVSWIGGEGKPVIVMGARPRKA